MLPLAAFSGLPPARRVAHRNMRARLPCWDGVNSGLWRVVDVVTIARFGEATLVDGLSFLYWGRNAGASVPCILCRAAGVMQGRRCEPQRSIAPLI